MKKKIVIAIVLVIGSVAAKAQKATFEQQEQIIKMQQEILQKVDSIQTLQAQMKSLYGSTMNMEDQLTNMSYAYGMSLADNLLSQGIDEIDYTAFLKGMQDVFNGDEPKMSVQEAQQVLNSYLSEIMNKKAQKAKEAGEKFLAENAQREGVFVTESGLQYEVLEEGDGGATPTATTKVTVHYHGTTITGEVFDSSVNRGQPASFGLNQVIKGWTEGLQLMSKGAKYRFFIPSDLAYGSRGAGQAIGPNETLIFDVELISF